MLVHRLATWRDGFDPFVVGPPPPTPAFEDVPFEAARAGWWPPVNRARRYGHAVARVLRERPAGLIEVHNRPELAMFLFAASWALRDVILASLDGGKSF